MNIFALNRKEKRQYLSYRCKHRHTAEEHPSCYLEEYGQKIAYFDIEATNLKSSFGIVLAYCLLGRDGTYDKRIITPEELRSGQFDKPLLVQLCKDLRKYQRIITWNGTWYDIPFCKSRCGLFGIPFPKKGELEHTDGLLIARKIFATLHSKRLGEVCKFFGIKAKDHPLNPEIWLKCLCGDREALSYVGDKHCKEDVYALRELWETKIEDYQKYTRTSL
jgi:uncharacterized protein YprB with RNaseH-like and TPR domain